MVKNYLLAWISSFRLKTLPLALSSIFIGNALAYWNGLFQWSIFTFTFLTASLLQILSNLANDYGDATKGLDLQTRLGPKRGIHQGILTASQLRFAIIINIILCVFSGYLLLIIASQSLIELIGFIGLGGLAIIAAITYTIGHKPYGYLGLGDLSVLIFFGLVGVLGSYYLQTGDINSSLFLPALGCGLLIVTVLNMNNLRDYENDKAGNKNTLIVLIGVQLGKYYHCALLITGLLFFTLFSLYYLHTIYSWLFIITLPFVYQHLKKIVCASTSIQFRDQFIVTIQLSLLINTLYGLGIILS